MGRNFDQLEAAVKDLVQRHRETLAESAELRQTLSERDERIRVLEAEMDVLNARRGDVGQRIEALISQIDELDNQLGAEA